MFSFNFASGGIAEKRNAGETGLKEIVQQCERISLDNSHYTSWNEVSTSILIGNNKMSIVDSSKVMEHLKNLGLGVSSVLRADIDQSDLLPGVYEGGMKIWESTFDLADYVAKAPDELLKNKTVLDLGCGAGILGIFALKNDCASAHFQDYNREVIANLTIANVRLNGENLLSKSHFWSGDWKCFETADDTQFDVIFTSETIYNPESYSKLHDVIKRKLKPGGSAYLAGKSYYFGVGGSMKGFTDFVTKENVLQVTPLWSTDAGVKREIILLKLRD